MSELITIKRVALTLHHLRPGRTKHTWTGASGTREFSPFIALEIARESDTPYCYLLHISENGEVADTWHPSLAEALEQAENEFGVQSAEWVDVS